MFRIIARYKDGTSGTYSDGYDNKEEAEEFAEGLPPKWSFVVSAFVEEYPDSCPCCGREY